MSPSKVFENLQNPQFYGSDVESVNMLQTHISYVALTGDYTYKVKKPVNFGFLDFTSLEKRKYFCEEELRLNRRLCPHIYLDVIPITQKNDEMELNGTGKVVDYAVKMKEFPQDRIMTNLLKHGKITEETINEICAILTDFYNSGERSQEIDTYGDIAAVKKNIDENFEQTHPVIDVTIPKNVYTFIQTSSNNFFQVEKEVFKQRIQHGHIHDCHGDLHSGNIVVTDDTICIFDCIEFNKRFRYIDGASDIGFLAMDLDFQNHPYLSSYLIKQYVEKSGDTGIYTVLNFYKCYRAYVRGKVIGFQLNDPHIDTLKKNEIVATARKYFDLSYYYASLFSQDLKKDRRPLLFIVCGLTGTGKSTVAQKLAIDHHAHLINTDVVRKEIAGIDKYERHHDSYDKGLYTPEKVLFTYKKVMERAAMFLQNGENVVLDATFQKRQHRDLVQTIAQDHEADFLFIYCDCPEEVVKQRLEARLRKKSVSDGRWEIYVEQKTSYEPLTSEENHLVFDTGNETYAYRMNIFQQIVKRINEAS
jgi:hypothetical protein